MTNHKHVLSEARQRETAESVLGRYLGWIAAADQKASFLVTVDLALVGTLASAWASGPANLGLPVLVLASVAGLGLLLSAGFAAVSVLPRLRGPPSELIFFGGSRHGQPPFIDRLRTASEATLVKDLASQCDENARIAAKKMGLVRRAFIALFWAVVPCLLAITLLWRESVPRDGAPRAGTAPESRLAPK